MDYLETSAALGTRQRTKTDKKKPKKTTTQKIKKMSNTDTTRKSAVKPGPRLFLGRGMNFLFLIACTAVLFQWFGKSFIGDGGKKKQSS